MLPPPCPKWVSLASGPDLEVIVLRSPASGRTEWELRTGGEPLSNLWPMEVSRLVLDRNGVQGCFLTAEAAFQSLQWWRHDSTRIAFEKCGIDDVNMMKVACERTGVLDAWRDHNFGCSSQFAAMLMVLQEKFRIPCYRDYLLSTRQSFLICHSMAPREDRFWADDWHGGGENRLGAALMLVRDEIAQESYGETSWPEWVQKPLWMSGKFNNNWQEVVNEVARYLSFHAESDPIAEFKAPEPRQVASVTEARNAAMRAFQGSSDAKTKRLDAKAKRLGNKAKQVEAERKRLEDERQRLEAESKAKAEAEARHRAEAVATLLRAERGRQAVRHVQIMMEEALAKEAKIRAEALERQERLMLAATRIQIRVRKFLFFQRGRRDSTDRRRLFAVLRLQSSFRGWRLRRRLPLVHSPINLDVTIIQARGLPKTGKAKTGPHPLCICQEHGHSQIAIKTPLVRNSLDPAWNHAGQILRVAGAIEFIVFDTDVRGTQLGKAELFYKDFCSDGFDGEVRLQGKGNAFLEVKVGVLNETPEVDIAGLKPWEKGYRHTSFAK